MSTAARIFFSSDKTDLPTVVSLQKALNTVNGDAQPVYWNGRGLTDIEYRKQAQQFIAQARLFVVVHSEDYHNEPDTRWEMGAALAELQRRPDFQVVTVQARQWVLPGEILPFPVFPHEQEAVEGPLRERQLIRVAQQIKAVLKTIPSGSLSSKTSADFQIAFPAVRERLLLMLAHSNLFGLTRLLKQLLHPERAPDALFQLEDALAEQRQQAQRNKLSFDFFQQKIERVGAALKDLILRIEPEQLHPEWPGVFCDRYFGLKPEETPANTLAGLFLPAGEIHTPQTLNLPRHVGAEEAWEGVGTMSHQQQQAFRRELLLCQDALGMGQFAQAYAYCDRVRTQIDPQSAQLYEYLLLSFLHRETPDRIIHDAVYGAGRLLHQTVVFAARFSEYHRMGRCPSESGLYNLEATAEALSDALARLYARFDNDYILPQGRMGQKPADNRAAVARCTQVAMEIFRTIHPYKGFLEQMVNELCNGGKYDYIRQVEIVNDAFRFASNEDFGLESEIRELIDMLVAAGEEPDALKARLRENLLISLKAKRSRLLRALQEEKMRLRRYTDTRASMIELIHAALLGHKIFGDQWTPDEASFLRLTIEQLLPGLLNPVASGPAQAPFEDVRWFTMDASGELAPHPECAPFRFDALTMLRKIAGDHAGHAGWLQVYPNIKEEVFKQYVADTERMYQLVAEGLQWTDFRKMHELDARRRLCECMRRWLICYRAYPETGLSYVERIQTELSGGGLLLWFYLDPAVLQTQADSLNYGFDAKAMLSELMQIPDAWSEEKNRAHITTHLFRRSIQPAYEALKPRAAGGLSRAAHLLWQAWYAFKIHPDLSFVDLIYREITSEVKYKWIDIDDQGRWYAVDRAFDAVNALYALSQIDGARFNAVDTRKRIADLRFKEQEAFFEREISELAHENSIPERLAAAAYFRRIKAIYRFYPDRVYLERALSELDGKGRIRWQSRFLGIFEVPENHYENLDIRFDYKAERIEFRLLWDHATAMYQDMLQETGVSGL